MKVIPYLGFDGNCEEAFRYYEKHIGGKVVAMFRHEGSPTESEVAPDQLQKIMHACLQVGDDFVMASDAPAGHHEKSQGFSVSLNVETVEEAERLFAALADGGNVTMPLQETFWAERFGMTVDRFGIPWMVNGPGKEFPPREGACAGDPK